MRKNDVKWTVHDSLDNQFERDDVAATSSKNKRGRLNDLPVDHREGGKKKTQQKRVFLKRVSQSVG